MKQLEISYRSIQSDADFIKFAIKYDIILAATLISLWMIVLGPTGKLDFIDFKDFELSKVTFSKTMGLLGLMMGAAYCADNWIIYDAVLLGEKTIDFNKRIDKEIAMIYGFLALAFLLMNLFGFFLGVLCLPFSPQFLFLVQQFVKRRNFKESQD